MLWGNWHVAHHSCRPQTAILCWFQANSFLLEKLLAVYLSQHFGGLHGDPKKTLMISRLVVVDKCDAHFEPIAAHCFSCQSWDLRVRLSSGCKLRPHLHFEALQVLLGICFKAMSFLAKTLFCMCVSTYLASAWFLNLPAYLYVEYIMRNAGLEEAQAGIKIVGRNINYLRYADDTTLMAKSEDELRSLLMKVKVESEKVGLKFNIQKTLRSWHLVPSLHGK